MHEQVPKHHVCTVETERSECTPHTYLSMVKEGTHLLARLHGVTFLDSDSKGLDHEPDADPQPPLHAASLEHLLAQAHEGRHMLPVGDLDGVKG